MSLDGQAAVVFPTRNPARAKSWVVVLNALLTGRQPHSAILEDLQRNFLSAKLKDPAALDSLSPSGNVAKAAMLVTIRNLRDALVDHFDIPADGGEWP